jgi:ABC-type nitrate/sulfonate/bicarbonate transport system substrate-binding protein
MRQLRISLIALFVLAGVACASDSRTGGENSGSNGEREQLLVAYGSDLDPNDVADQFGLQEAGAEITTLNEDSQAFAGLVRDEFDVANVGFIETVRAVEAGMPLKVFYVAQRRFEFVALSQPEITEYEQLAGKTVANYSATAIEGKVLLREPLAKIDPSLVDEVNWVVMQESPNRAAAMLGNKIQATTLEFGDYLRLTEEKDFNVLKTMADVTGPGSEAISTVWVTTEDNLEKNQEQIEELAHHLQDGYDKTYEDEEAWLDLATETIPTSFERNILSQTYDFYVDLEMYPKSNENPLTEEIFEATNEFNIEAGEYEDPPDASIVEFDLISKVSEE